MLQYILYKAYLQITFLSERLSCPTTAETCSQPIQVNIKRLKGMIKEGTEVEMVVSGMIIKEKALNKETKC